MNGSTRAVDTSVVVAGVETRPEDDASAAERAGVRAPQTSFRRRCAVAVLALAFVGLSVAGHRALDGVLVDAFAALVLALLAAIDVERRIIPNRIVLPAAAVVLAGRIAEHPHGWSEYVLASLGAAVLLFLPSLFNRSAIGMGDVKLGLLVGATLGWRAILAIPLGLLLAGLVSAAILIRGGRSARGSTIPLAPFFAVGSLIAVLAMPHL